MSNSSDKSEKQKTAEAEVDRVRSELGPFVVASETTRMAMVFTDATDKGNPIVFANDSACELTGYSRDELLGQDFDFLLGRAAAAESVALIEQGFTEPFDDVDEVRIRRKDGSEFWAALFVSPVRDDHGVVVQHFASLVDLTRHKAEQSHSRKLIEELNHRVKNTLSTVQSMVRQALRATNDASTVREVIESRLMALSRSHDLLSRENWKTAGLHDLISDALDPFGELDGRSGRFTITGANIRLPPRAALALGIALNELATNAVKYGALSREGSVVVGWTVALADGGRRLNLRWEERDGPDVAPPTRRGFGSRAIEQGLAQELDGAVRLDFRPEGLICTMDFPVPVGAGDG